MSTPSKSPTDQTSCGRARHKWFPALVLGVAAIWWIRQAAQAQYQTFNHFIVSLFCLALVSLWYLRFGGGANRSRQLLVGGILLCSVAFFAICRPVFNGDMGIFSWKLRFARDADERLAPIAATGQADNWQTTPQDYPRFLGNGHWPEVSGVRLETDWESHPPQELWRREIGAGWSAFAVVGKYAVTQEQRGEHELVSCYRVETGEPVWVHSDVARFDPADVAGSLGDVGPRRHRRFTPIESSLKAARGSSIVSTHARATCCGPTIRPKSLDRQWRVWGKSGSPLVVDDMVIVSVGGPADSTTDAASQYDTSLVAFDTESGDVRWTAGSRKAAYASPVLADLAGERQILIVNESYLTAHRASDGKVLWEHPWGHATDESASAAQPVPLSGDRVFLSKGYGVGASLLSIRRGVDDRFEVKPLWKPAIKRVMKTKFSNVVMRDGFVYGLDDVLLECIELETGKVRWKNRRQREFGHGQIMLIGDVLLVLSEFGELALVEATPKRYHELASMHGLDDAHVTWNNPAFAPPYLLVRNAREAACFRLPLKQ